MKRLLIYYKLVMLDSAAFVGIFISSIITLIVSIEYVSPEKMYAFGLTVPLCFGLLFILLDVSYIATCRDYDEEYINVYLLANRRKKRKLTKYPRNIQSIITAFSTLGIITSICLILAIRLNYIIGGILPYVFITVLGIVHLYEVNKKV